MRGLHILLEGLIFGRAYIRWEICVTKSIGLASSWNGSKKSYYIHKGDFMESFLGSVLRGLFLELGDTVVIVILASSHHVSFIIVLYSMLQYSSHF